MRQRFASVLAYAAWRRPVCYTLAITFGTASYHFLIRLLVGWLVLLCMPKYVDAQGWWFRPKKCEQRFYRLIRIKAWKDKVPTYNPDSFSVSKDRLHDLVRTMCVSEAGHEIMLVCGYFSVLFCFITGDWHTDVWIFLATAFAAGLFDFVFVLLQRYNRPRLVRLLKR